ncbi:hypothetical protein CWI36_0013p0030 [Hamiltosporidium magnivora]|uniref:Uncharacterized protein n=1 Tax=Hamiltosporidium magnivora TaxID=148818 RepID=A0A4Q9LQ18_9MICR|nr:hypothetical protein CWI36_0013p0030 [Hamiltosporidium magnivora]
MKYIFTKKNLYELFVRIFFVCRIYSSLVTNNSARDILINRKDRAVMESKNPRISIPLSPSLSKYSDVHASALSQPRKEERNISVPRENYCSKEHIKYYGTHRFCENTKSDVQPKNGSDESHQNFSNIQYSQNHCLERWSQNQFNGDNDMFYGSNNMPMLFPMRLESLIPIPYQYIDRSVSTEHESEFQNFKPGFNEYSGNKDPEVCLDQNTVAYPRYVDQQYIDLPSNVSLNRQERSSNSEITKRHDSHKRKQNDIILDSSNPKKICTELNTNFNIITHLQPSAAISFTEKNNQINNESVETESKYYQLAIKTVTRFMDKNDKFYCENYKYFLSFIPCLYQEIEFESHEKSFDLINTNPIFSHISRNNWNTYIDAQLDNYNSIIVDSENEFNQILEFGEGLIFYEKYFPSHVSPTQLICLYETMLSVLLKIKTESNFGLFYELIKFVAYYEYNLYDHVDLHHNLYVYFILSIISKQLKNIDLSIFLHIKVENCTKDIICQPFDNKRCQEHRKYFYLQRLFSKLLLGMKNGKLRTKFYDIVIILELSSLKHHSKLFFNQTVYFRFYLRVLVSFLLEPKFNSSLDILDKFLQFSIDILNLKRDFTVTFSKEIKSMIEKFELGAFTVELNLKIIDEVRVPNIGNKFYIQGLAYLRKKFLPSSIETSFTDMFLSLNDIIMSEMCLSGYLSKIYECVNFDLEVMRLGLKVIYERRLKM